MSDAVPVLFIAGTGRSGSTLVANILGSLPGAVSVGELRHVWRRGTEQNWFCGCGVRFGECQFWADVLKTAQSSGHAFDIEAIKASERSLLRLRASWQAPRWVRRPTAPRHAHSEYREALNRLYRAIQEVSGAQVIVDSSKTPSYGAILSTLPGLDVRFLHLVRDPRATAYSWLHPKFSPDRSEPSTMDRLGVAKSAFLWFWWNGLAEVISGARPDIQRLRMTYESIMDDPAGSIRTICESLAMELAASSAPIAGRVVELSRSHTVSGNPDRMASGPITMLVDDRWRDHLSTRHRATVVAIGGVTMRRYGYLPSTRERFREIR